MAHGQVNVRPNLVAIDREYRSLQPRSRSTQNLSAELFKTSAGIVFTIIPHRGTPEVQISLLQGDIALMIDSYSSMKGNLDDGKFRALASSGPVRSKSTPDIATLRESGVANYEVVSWNALFAPAGTPPEIVNKLNGALQEILADADVKNRLIELGIEARASTPQEISARLTSDIDKWQKVIEKAGIQSSSRVAKGLWPPWRLQPAG